MANLASSLRVIMGEHGAVEAIEALSQRHVVRKVLPSLGCLWREELNDSSLALSLPFRSFDRLKLGDLRS